MRKLRELLESALQYYIRVNLDGIAAQICGNSSTTSLVDVGGVDACLWILLGEGFQLANPAKMSTLQATGRCGPTFNSLNEWSTTA